MIKYLNLGRELITIPKLFLNSSCLRDVELGRSRPSVKFSSIFKTDPHILFPNSYFLCNEPSFKLKKKQASKPIKSIFKSKASSRSFIVGSGTGDLQGKCTFAPNNIH